jgi:hypothetical protein
VRFLLILLRTRRHIRQVDSNVDDECNRLANEEILVGLLLLDKITFCRQLGLLDGPEHAEVRIGHGT